MTEPPPIPQARECLAGGRWFGYGRGEERLQEGHLRIFLTIFLPETSENTQMFLVKTSENTQLLEKKKPYKDFPNIEVHVRLGSIII